ncbi:hypothetical protein L7F22_020301 [Adiantum nelumboides]|nr:hypothetical protein [Adiantum nelumboides]
MTYTATKKKPMIRVVQIHNPVYVQTDALNFPSLVQKLTGRQSTDCRTREFCDLALSAEPPSEEYHRGRAYELVDNFAATPLEGSTTAYCCCGSFYCSMYPSLYRHHQECCSFQKKLELGGGHKQHLGSMKMQQQQHGFSELDIWAGLLSEQSLPDISTLPPLLF